jgi:phosphotransferase system HPr (HPr) family protein
MRLDASDNDGAAAPKLPSVQAKALLTLRNRVGLHSRPAGAFVRIAKGFSSSIKVTYADKEADGKSILSILSLEAGQGAFIAVEAVGIDAPQAVQALRELVRDNFGEPD